MMSKILLFIMSIIILSSIVYGSPSINSYSPKEDNSTSIYSQGQFTVNVSVQDPTTLESYVVNITKKSDSTSVWDFTNSSINSTDFSLIKTLDVSTWENTTYVFDNKACNYSLSCVREIYEFEFIQPYPPVITVYSPTQREITGKVGDTISFDIEVSDNNNDIISYQWKVNNVVKSTSEDYDYLITGGVNTKYNITVIATDDSIFLYTDNDNWNLTSTAGYHQTYDKTDFKNIVVDGMGTTGASVVGWIDLLIILVILGVIIGTFIKLGKSVRG